MWEGPPLIQYDSSLAGFAHVWPSNYLTYGSGFADIDQPNVRGQTEIFRQWVLKVERILHVILWVYNLASTWDNKKW